MSVYRICLTLLLSLVLAISLAAVAVAQTWQFDASGTLATRACGAGEAIGQPCSPPDACLQDLGEAVGEITLVCPGSGSSGGGSSGGSTGGGSSGGGSGGASQCSTFDSDHYDANCNLLGGCDTFSNLEMTVTVTSLVLSNNDGGYCDVSITFNSAHSQYNQQKRLTRTEAQVNTFNNPADCQGAFNNWKGNLINSPDIQSIGTMQWIPGPSCSTSCDESTTITYTGQICEPLTCNLDDASNVCTACAASGRSNIFAGGVCCGDDNADCGSFLGSSQTLCDAGGSVTAAAAYDRATAGVVRTLSCNNQQYISTGSQWFTCAQIAAQPNGELTIGSTTYICSGGSIAVKPSSSEQCVIDGGTWVSGTCCNTGVYFNDDASGINCWNGVDRTSNANGELVEDYTTHQGKDVMSRLGLFYACEPQANNGVTQLNDAKNANNDLIPSGRIEPICTRVGNLFCNGAGWEVFNGQQDHYSAIPAGEAPNAQVREQCCPDNTCYNGVTCVANQANNFGEGSVHGVGANRCINGEWEAEIQRTSHDGQETGFCTAASQCLVSINDGCVNTGSNVQSNDPNGNDYCDNGVWTTHPRYANQASCQNAGFSWLQDTCCQNNVYFNTQTGSDPRSCWNSYVLNDADGNGALLNDASKGGSIQFDNTVLNSDGVFLGCNADTADLSLVDTENTGALIGQNQVACTTYGIFYCPAQTGLGWTQTLNDFNSNAIQQSTVPVAFNSGTMNRPTACCDSNRCWDGNTCVADQKGQAADGPYFTTGASGNRCIGGSWTFQNQKTDLQGNTGYCPSDAQCLVDVNGRFEDNNNTAAGRQPQCILDGQFVDIVNYCNNGAWTSHPDYSDRAQCEGAGFSWFANSCCQFGKYFSTDDPTNPKGCWDTAVVVDGDFDSSPIPFTNDGITLAQLNIFTLSDRNNSGSDKILNFDGQFYACNLPNDYRISIPDTKDGGILMGGNEPKCAHAGTFYCPDDQSLGWTEMSDLTISRKSIPSAVGINQLGNENRVDSCCSSNQCWNGTACIGDQVFVPSEGPSFTTSADGHRCVLGDWQVQQSKTDLQGNVGYCQYDSQCLVSVSGLPGDNNKTGSNPQCINDGQFIGFDFCDNGEWGTHPQYFDQTSCEAPGFAWLHGHCCQEDQEYETDGSDPTSCWQTHVISDAGLDGALVSSTVSGVEDTILQVGGDYYACNANNVRLDMDDTRDQTKLFADPSNSLGYNQPRCSDAGDFFCSSNTSEGWKVKTTPTVQLSAPPAGVALDSSLNVADSCCADNACWNGTVCVGSQIEQTQSSVYFSDTNDGHRCLDGTWTYQVAKTDLNGQIGFCPSDSQCLVNVNGRFDENGNPQGNPQCISDRQFIGNDYCDQGTWAKRTQILFDHLYRSGLDFSADDRNVVVFCDEKDFSLNVFNADQFLNPFFEEDQTYCVLEHGDNTVVGTLLDTPLQPFNSVDISTYINLFGQPYNCDAAITPNAGSEFNFNSCTPANAWYNPGLQMFVTGRTPQLRQTIDFPEWRSDIDDFTSRFEAVINQLSSDKPAWWMPPLPEHYTAFYYNVIDASTDQWILGALEDQFILLRFHGFGSIDLCNRLDDFSDVFGSDGSQSGLLCEEDQNGNFFVLGRGSNLDVYDSRELFTEITAKVRAD